ncbi:MAG: hypothetical protein LBE82_12320 [Chitinophagaceae bacterium]|jgi:hypothetical protein|nr:hypothetical protein [Chitinophagaceae bacterium]
MKKETVKYFLPVLLLSIIGTGNIAKAQDTTKPNLLLNLSYFNSNNQYQYLSAKTKTKIDGKFLPVPNINLSFFISSESETNFLGKAKSDEKGEAVLFIPPAAKEEWNKSSKQSFIVVSEANKQFDAAKGTADIVKAKIKLDTAEDRKIMVVLLELKDTAWTPVKGVDMQIAIKKFGGNLNISSETPSYTTDSLGSIAADFKRDSLAGDTKGNLTLVASVDDNDTYGNLTAEKIVPWGVPVKYVSNFNQRTLFARRGHSPWWLELMAYSVILMVWGVLVFLIFQIRRMKKLGKATEEH